jgi:hypothetical protein
MTDVMGTLHGHSRRVPGESNPRSGFGEGAFGGNSAMPESDEGPRIEPRCPIGTGGPGHQRRGSAYWAPFGFVRPMGTLGMSGDTGGKDEPI